MRVRAHTGRCIGNVHSLPGLSRPDGRSCGLAWVHPTRVSSQAWRPPAAPKPQEPGQGVLRSPFCPQLWRRKAVVEAGDWGGLLWDTDLVLTRVAGKERGSSRADTPQEPGAAPSQRRRRLTTQSFLLLARTQAAPPLRLPSPPRTL